MYQRTYEGLTFSGWCSSSCLIARLYKICRDLANMLTKIKIKRTNFLYLIGTIWIVRLFGDFCRLCFARNWYSSPSLKHSPEVYSLIIWIFLRSVLIIFVVYTYNVCFLKSFLQLAWIVIYQFYCSQKSTLILLVFYDLMTAFSSTFLFPFILSWNHRRSVFDIYLMHTAEA